MDPRNRESFDSSSDVSSSVFPEISIEKLGAVGSSQSRTCFYLWLECVALYVGLPVFLYTQRDVLDAWLVPILLLLAAGCTFVLWKDSTFRRKKLWNREAFRERITRTLRWFVPGALVVGGAFAIFRPDLLLTFPRVHPEVWLLLLITYPVLSVYPQEIIFRAFFFHRYHPLFPSVWGKVTASGIAFGLAHVIFANWLAPVMTAVIGIQFAFTYARTESTLQAAVEHGLWGVYAFTVGLGWYVYSGAI